MTVVQGVRFDRLDALRGVAMVWMAVFHLSFDLNFYGLLQPRQNFYHDPFWTQQRTAIVSLFLLCAGLGQAIALQAGQGWPRFWRRWAQVAGCAVLVSLGSAWMFPKSWISFGVLHGMAVMLVLARLAAPLRGGLWLLGAVALVLPWLVKHPFFDTPFSNWVGLITRKPVTEDYVPLLPWLGVVWLGVWAGSALLRLAPALRDWQADGVWAVLALLGRRSLLYYMLHQPVMIGSLWLLKTLAA